MLRIQLVHQQLVLSLSLLYLFCILCHGFTTSYHGLRWAGKYVRVGDAILIQTFKSDHLLSLYEGIGGAEVKLVYRDRAGLGAELWRVEQFDSVPLPDWYYSRPYLK